jgi:hypothetical protein
LSLKSSVGQPAVYGWDWSATTHDARGFGSSSTVRQVVEDMTTALGGSRVLPTGKGLQGWADSLDVFDDAGYRLGRVYHGGDRTDVHVVATSSAADEVRDRAVGLYGARTARVDTRVDSLVPFEDLAGILEAAADGYGSRITRMDSSQRGESLGRTVYLGAPSSAVRVRLYEKHLESPGEYVEGTNRVEVQLRPPSKVKDRVSGWSRAETFCASRVTRDLASRLGADLAPASSLHVRRPTPDLEASLEAMGNQYGRAVQRWMEVSAGDVGTLLDHMLSKS